jgi:hypothetical protein
MVKFTLVIWVCSFLGDNLCMRPIQSNTLYDSWYECSRAAHKESLQILSKIGYKAINDNKLGTRYMCKIDDTV